MNDTAAIILTVILAVGSAYAALAHKLGSFGERLARIERALEGWIRIDEAADEVEAAERDGEGQG